MPNVAYVYPNIAKELRGAHNPYIDNLKKALAENGFTVDPSTSNNAFGNLFAKGIHADLLVLNWMENVPDRRFGLAQALALLIYLSILRLKGVAIIWIRHNKISHAKKRALLKKTLIYVLGKYAHRIIVHSEDATMKTSEKVMFLHHPIQLDSSEIMSEKSEPDIDLLIWGNMAPYKGVREFASYAAQHVAFHKLNIHIIGQFKYPGYWEACTQWERANIKVVNHFPDKVELQELFRRSRFILFTYQPTSVLSSGVLMDSLLACKRIIASDCGAFRDLADSYGFVSIYQDFSEIPELYNTHYNDFRLDQIAIKTFFNQNSWDNMGARLKALYTSIGLK